MSFGSFHRSHRKGRMGRVGQSGHVASFDFQALESRVLLSGGLVPDPVINAPMTSQSLVIGSGPEENAHVQVLDTKQDVLQDYYPFETFTGGIDVASGDIDGDGTPDVIVAAQKGGSSNIRVFSGYDGQPLADPLGSFLAFPGPSSDVTADRANPTSDYYRLAFQGMLNIASGDVNGDGHADIIVAVGANGPPHVQAFSGVDGSVLMSTLVYPGAVTDPSDPLYFSEAFQGGVNVAAGDVNADGYADIVVAPAAGMSPTVKVFDGATQTMTSSFDAYDPAYLGGSTVAVGDYNNDGLGDIITAPGIGVGPNVRVFNAADGATLASFWAYDPAFLGGTRVAAGDASGAGQADIVVIPGPNVGANVKIFKGNDGYAPATLASFMAPGGSTTGDRITMPSVEWHTLYAAYYSEDLIKSFNAQYAGTTFASGGSLDGPFGMAFDEAGNLYVSSALTNHIYRFDASGVATQFDVSGTLSYPEGMAFDEAGNLYVANQGADNIMKFDSSGVGTQFNVDTVYHPNDVAFDSDGNLYVSNYGMNSIGKFDSTGHGTRFDVSGTLNGPFGLAFDKAGNLYVSNTTSHAIMKFDSSGAGARFDVSGTPQDPTGMAFDRAGNLYVADYLGNNIWKFDTSGAGVALGASGALNGPIDVAFSPS